MKKLVTLLLAAGMVFSAVNGASAVEMKVSGEWQVGFTFSDNMYGEGAPLKDKYRQQAIEDGNIEGSKGSFKAAQRIRINFDLVASEYLSGRVQLQAAREDGGNTYDWGRNGVGGAGSKVTARMAYLDWMIPTTDVLVRMGRQSVDLPSYTFGSPVLGSLVDGVMVSAPINDMVGVNVGWMRPSAEQNKWGGEHKAHSSIDLAYLGVDVAADGFKVTPWGMIGFVGSEAGIVRYPALDKYGQPDPRAGYINYDDSDNFDMLGFDYADENTTAYWVGIGGELSLFDPFKFTADFIYSGNDADKWAKREGWYAALGAEMKTSFATPFLRGWYASGDDADSKKSGRMLGVGNGEGGFDASGIYFDYFSQITDTIDVTNPAGTWGVQLGVKEVSFIEDLSHQLSVTYFQGTNNTEREAMGHADYTADNPFGYMTTADSAWSIDFMNSYKLYQNLTANLLLSYLVTDFDKDVWGAEYDNIFRGTLNFTYTF